MPNYRRVHGGQKAREKDQGRQKIQGRAGREEEALMDRDRATLIVVVVASVVIVLLMVLIVFDDTAIPRVRQPVPPVAGAPR